MNSKEILMPALRQYRHNQGEGFIPGYEYEEANEIVANLLSRIVFLENEALTIYQATLDKGDTK